MTEPAARLRDVGLRYGRTAALDGVTLEIPGGIMAGLIGPDGVGKSSLLSLIAGARAIQAGRVEVFGGEMADARHRAAVGPRIAYMPQGLGKNLYPTLSVAENIDFFGRLFGHDRAERQRRIAELTASTGLAPFAGRPAGKLSGGMKQKLGLCCALIHDPDLLILDEPTTGVDPLSRSQFWDLTPYPRRPPAWRLARPPIWRRGTLRLLAAMDAGRCSPAAARRTAGTPGAASLVAAFIALLHDEERAGYRGRVLPREWRREEIAIEAHGLTRRSRLSRGGPCQLRIPRGESSLPRLQWLRQTTTMKMLTRLRR